MRRLVDMIGLRRLETEKPSVPAGTAVFAVGDIHGRLDLLVEMHQKIIAAASMLPADTRKTIVYLGNYIDGGPDGAEVIDLLLSVYMPGFRSVYLMGEREHYFANFLKGKITPQVKAWLYEQGGLRTIASYGVNVTVNRSAESIQAMRVDLLRKIPTDHLSFLENLQLSFGKGDFFFVHAGIDPSRALNEQNPSDLLTITDGFLDCEAVLDKVVIHGHAPYPTACVRRNRIGLNTVAHNTGILSGIMITGDRFNIIRAHVSA